MKSIHPKKRKNVLDGIISHFSTMFDYVQGDQIVDCAKEADKLGDSERQAESGQSNEPDSTNEVFIHKLLVLFRLSNEYFVSCLLKALRGFFLGNIEAYIKLLLTKISFQLKKESTIYEY